MTATKCDHCGALVTQSGRGRPRRFCSPECTRAYWRKQVPRKGRERHTLSEIDPDSRTGICSLCGPTPLYRSADTYSDGRPRTRWYCSNRVKGNKANRQTEIREENWRRRGITGMTVERFDALSEKQGGVCALCRGEMKPACVDHCHTTGEPRGLLCKPCNTAIGRFGDDPDRLDAAAAYLRSYITNQR